jgi:putative ABC transport system permease protein
MLDLRAHRVRSTIAGLALLVAVLSVVAVATVGTVVRDTFVARDEQLNGRLWTMSGHFESLSLTSMRLAEITNHLEHQVMATGGFYALVAVLDGSARTVRPGSAPGSVWSPEDGEKVEVVLTQGRLGEIRRLPLLEGHWPTPRPDQVYPAALVLNQAASDLLGGPEGAVSLAFGDNTPPSHHVVAGVIADGRPVPRIYQSMSSALHLRPSLTDPPNDLRPELLVHYPGATEAAIEQRIRDVASNWGMPADSVQVIGVGSLADFLSNLDKVRLAFGVVSAITLVVATLGLLNIGLATLRERIRELSLRRAVGATRLRIFGLVLTNTLLLSVATAGLAVIIGYLAVEWLFPQMLDPTTALHAPTFPWDVAGYALAAALGSGIVGGLVPAVVAARVNVITVLRE